MIKVFHVLKLTLSTFVALGSTAVTCVAQRFPPDHLKWMIVVASKIEPVIVNAKLLLPHYHIDLLLIYQLLQLAHTIVLVHILDNDYEAAFLALFLIELAYIQMFEKIETLNASLGDFLILASLLHTIKRTMVVLVNALSQVRNCILIEHIFPTAALMMLAIKLQIL